MRLILFGWFIFGKNVEKYGKTAVFPGGKGPDWGNTARAATAGLGSKGLNCIGPTLRPKHILPSSMYILLSSKFHLRPNSDLYSG